MSERFFDSRANRDKLDQWLTTPPEDRFNYDAQFDEGDDTPEDDPVVWLVDVLLQHWSESLPVVLETLEGMHAPEPVLAAVRR